MKSFLRVTALLLTCSVAAAVFFWFWPSRLKDRIVSAFIGSQLHAPVSFYGTSFGPRGSVHFESMEALGPGGNREIFSTGPGSLRALKRQGGAPSYLFVAEDAVLRLSLDNQYSSWSIWPDGGLKNSLGFRSIRLYAKGSPERAVLRILDAQAAEFSLRGGFTLIHRRMEKLNLSGYFSSQTLSRLPAHVLKYSPADGSARRLLRLTYGGSIVTVLGKDGPIYQFSGKLA